MATKKNSQDSSPKKGQKTNLPLVLGGIVALGALGILGWNVSIAQSRVLHLVSGLEKPVSVQLPGLDPVGVSPGKITRIQMAEGDYDVVIDGAIKETVKISVRSSFMDRFTKKPLWVLNVGGSALLFSESISPDGELSDFKVHYGQPFVSWLNVDLPFTDSPEEPGGKQSLIRVDLFKEPLTQAFFTILNTGVPEEALDLAEWHLRKHREDSQMLSAYLAVCKELNQNDRLKKFIVEGTQIRPVEIDWHRAYQDLMMTPKDHGTLIAEYDELLKKDPNNSSLLYLRGRICISQRQALDFYNRALITSFNNAFAHFAIAGAEAGRGEWNNANASIRVARSLRPDILQFQDKLFETRMALADYEVLEQELLQAVQQVPLDSTLNVFLCDVLAAARKNDLAKQICDAFENRWSQTYNQPPPVSLRSRVLYSIGDFETMVKLYANNQNDEARMAYFEALVELGRLEEATRVIPIDDASAADPFHYLAYAIGWKMYGNEKNYQLCSKRAFEMLKNMRPDYAILADLLNDNEPPTVSEVTDIPILPKMKAIALAYLAQKFPAEKAEYMAMARKLNIDRSYPYHMITRIAGAEQKTN
ncbi:MAG: tetratricopeptide repeat protein [Limisphaerales bacterium]